MTKKPDANWSCSLDVNCPECDETFNFLEAYDYQEYLTGVQPLESGVDIDIFCPECEHEFTATTSY
ncbi:hypothetical protein LXL81_07175 [Dyadobacter sp. CY356]|nr:hypothetical protein [Dyadobacter sp. CY356]